MHTVIMTCILH